MQDRSSRPNTSPNRTSPATTKRCISFAATASRGAGAARLPPRHRTVDSSSDTGRKPPEPTLARRPRHRGAHSPLRASAPRLPDPCRREEARQHPRRRRLAPCRPEARRPEPVGDTGQAAQQVQGSQDGTCLRARRTRHHGRASLVRQRRRLLPYIWRDTCAALGITPKHTRPYWPQTNGKIERFHCTLADGLAYARCCTSEAERRQALGGAATSHRSRA